MHDPNEYAITCRRTLVEDETVFEARVMEFPDVIGYGDTRAEAEDAALEAIRGLQALARERGRSLPAPMDIPQEYNGRITLRLSRSQHRQAAALAAAEDVSLNALICEAIAERLARRADMSRQTYLLIRSFERGVETHGLMPGEKNSPGAYAGLGSTAVLQAYAATPSEIAGAVTLPGNSEVRRVIEQPRAKAA